MSIFQELHDDVFAILKSQLPSFLTYHTPEHTAYVVEQAEYISRQENVNGRDLYLIKIAALFHDIGFIRQTNHHEDIGCQICADKLRQYDFSVEDIQTICGMIMATKIPQHPVTLLEKIVADADLEYLGTDLFKPVSKLLYNEYLHYDPHLTIQRFDEIQISFLKRHHFHTDYCKEQREGKKQEHLQELLDSEK